jgi:hypothetical protein
MLKAWIRASSLQKTNGFSNYSDEDMKKYGNLSNKSAKHSSA